MPLFRTQAVQCFSAHKNGTSQTGIADITGTDLTWSTLLYNVGGKFSGDAWTPDPGKISLKGGALVSGTWAAGATIAVRIVKNGSAFWQGTWFSAKANAQSVFIAVDDIANGADVYKMAVYADVTSGTASVDGTQANTWFMGHRIGP